MKCKLSDICSFRKGKLEVNRLNTHTYISTENMLPNKCGISEASSLPTVALTQEYRKGDVLVSNIRPYFKKIWQAKYDGGCSNDVLVFEANSNTDKDFLYYILANDDFFEYSMATSKGTKMPRGDKTSIMQYEVPVFNLDSQKKIASILKSIDDKIELNNAINIDLPEKTGRKKKSTTVRKNKRVLGNSIEERPKEIEERNEFGHWEIDTVVGTKDESEPSVLTIVERQTRMSLWFKIKNHTSEAVLEALNRLVQSFDDKAALVFKTITGDNGSEFAQIADLEGKGLQIYFTHPYSSWEKGTNECHNKMLRRFIPKVKAISDYSTDDILFFSDIINNLPRKILNYQTPEQLFEQQLDLIYAA